MTRKRNKTDGANRADGAGKDADGLAAWARLQRQTRPLSAAQRNRHEDAPRRAPKAPKKLTQSTAAKAAGTGAYPPIAPSRAHQKAGDKPPPRPVLPTKTRRRLGRGRLPIDGSLDLHGLSLREAEAALLGFVAYHRAQGHVWVLVITGKGVRGEGRLRAALPEWLARPPLAAQVSEYETATLAHGGSGAFYLRLRRNINAPAPPE